MIRTILLTAFFVAVLPAYLVSSGQSSTTGNTPNASHSPAKTSPDSERDEKLKSYLRSYLDIPSPSDDSVRYAAAFVDLNEDGMEEAIVYVIGDDWCGSGGCSTLVLAPHGATYKVITRMTVMQLPIRVLTTKTNGWHDLGATVYGGGVGTSYVARLQFNGRKYPSNPTVHPAQRLRGKVEGNVVIAAKARGIPL